MPGKLFVLARAPNPGGWTLIASALDAAEAGDFVREYLLTAPRGRVIVANAIRSFVGTVQQAEDAVPTVEP